jgi:hypothetical protein
MLKLIVEGEIDSIVLPELIEQAQRAKLLPKSPGLLSLLSSTDSYLVVDGAKPAILAKNDFDSIGLENLIKDQVSSTDYRKFLILLDGDRTFPPYLLPTGDRDLTKEFQELPQRVQDFSQNLGVGANVHWAKIELESWIIGGLCEGEIKTHLKSWEFHIRRISENTVIKPSDPKNWLLSCLSHRRQDYIPSAVMEYLVQEVDIQKSCNRNSSLREFFDILTVMAA